MPGNGKGFANKPGKRRADQHNLCRFSRPDGVDGASAGRRPAADHRGRRPQPAGSRAQRHGGGAGEDRGADRAGLAEAWRQCRGRRRGDRLRARRHAPASGKSRRRRLHGRASGEGKPRYRARLSRDRACGGHGGRVSRRFRRSGPEEITRQRARRRHAGHGGGARLRPRKMGIGQILARRPAGARHPARPGGRSGRG